MRWFKGNAEAPRLLSLSPLRGDDDIEGESLHFHGTAGTRDMSPVRWSRRKSSGSESERNCYNVPTSQVTTEKSPSKKDKKKIQEERRRSCEKRNPLLDRVKNTRLSFFKDKLPDDDFEEDEKSHFRSMSDLDKHNLMRNDFRRSVCEIDLKQITEEEKTQAKRKRRSKSHTRVASRKNDEKFSFLSFTSSPIQKSCWSKEEAVSSPTRKSFYGHKTLKDCEPQPPVDVIETEEPEIQLDGSQFDSVTPSSCLAAKFRAMQDRYLKSSTNRLIAKIYRRDGKDRDKRRLRSFSYGTLPGLDELRTNPLFEDQDQDDNDSGILDNGSATSSLLDDRCSSGASGLITNMTSDSSPPLPPQIPPRKPVSSITGTGLDLEMPIIRKSSTDLSKHHSRMSVHNACLGIEKNPLGCINQATNDEVIQRYAELRNSSSMKDKRSKRLSVVRSRSCTTETMVVKLPRETVDQSLGIFIAKTVESSPGYLVAHVVPNGLADKEGTLKIGDEILIVNGRRLRGLDMGEARKVLGSGNAPGEVDIVISRYTSIDPAKKLKESSVDYENVSMEQGHGVIVENACSPKLHFRKHHSRHHRDRKSSSNRSISSEKNTSIEGTPQTVSNFCTLPRRPRSSVSTFHTVVFEKGPGKKSLGFTIVGGRDSPKGSIGIFIKSVLPGGQAAEDGRLRAGDEILAVNGQVSHDLTHREAVQLFRSIKSGPLALHLCRRVKQRDIQMTKAKSCADLLIVDP